MWQYNYTPSSDELYHHGIKGQRWGVRRYQNKDGTLTPAGKKRNKSETRREYESAKEQYRTAKKEYKRAALKADTGRHQAYSLSKKKREANSERWDEAFEKGQKYGQARKEYKNAKSLQEQKRKAALDEVRKEMNTSLYNDAAKKRAAKYIADNDISLEDAVKLAKSDANKNTVAFLSAFLAYQVLKNK